MGNRINDLSNEEISTRVILATTNKIVRYYNDCILNLLDGEKKEFLSEDSLDEDGVDSNDITLEFLNSLWPSGLPPHKLVLKKNAIVILLRNIDPEKGFCNGTRLRVLEMGTNVLKLETLEQNPLERKIILLPKMTISPTTTNIPFKFKRRQFPLNVSYCLSIHKSQGQTFEKVGVDLSDDLFTHGQLYVAVSRCRRKTGLKIKLKENANTQKNNNKIYNIVYESVLN